MKMVWRCRCGKRVENLNDENFGDCGCSDPVYGPEYFYMTIDCADMLDEMDKGYSEQQVELNNALAELAKKNSLIETILKERDAAIDKLDVQWQEERIKRTKFETELVEALARIGFLDHTIDAMNNELAELCPEGQSVVELIAAKDELIKQLCKGLEAVIRVADRDTDEFTMAKAALLAARGVK